VGLPMVTEIGKSQSSVPSCNRPVRPRAASSSSRQGNASSTCFESVHAAVSRACSFSSVAPTGPSRFAVSHRSPNQRPLNDNNRIPDAFLDPT
jgi:hypothetical protein